MGKRVLRRSAATPDANTRKEPGNDVAARVAGVSRLGAIGKESVMSRGKRKRTEKRARVERKQDFIDTELRRLETEAVSRRATLASKNTNHRSSSALAGLSTLADALGPSAPQESAVDEAKKTTGGGDRPVQKVVHEKARRQILADESAQVRNVIEHPSYQADPMEALRQHLMNTVQDDPLGVPEALAPTVLQKEKQKLREERQGVANQSRRKDSEKKTGRNDSSSRRRDAKAELAAKARSGRIKKNARSVERAESLGRIGVPRPKLTKR